MAKNLILLVFCIVGILLQAELVISAEPKTVEPRTPEPKMTLHRASVGSASADGWYEAKSTGGKFSVKFPRQFDDYELEIMNKPGEPVRTVHYLRSVRPSEKNFTAVRTPNFRPTPIVADEMLPGAVKVFRDKGVLTKENRTTVLGRPALDYEVKDNGQHVIFRIVVFPQSIITLSVEAKNPTEIAPDAKRFFDSLQADE